MRLTLATARTSWPLTPVTAAHHSKSKRSRSLSNRPVISPMVKNSYSKISSTFISHQITNDLTIFSIISKTEKKKKITLCLTAIVLHSAPERFTCLHLLLKAHQKLTPHPPPHVSSRKKSGLQTPCSQLKHPSKCPASSRTRCAFQPKCLWCVQTVLGELKF